MMTTPDNKEPRIYQYLQIADQLRRQIRKGILKPGDRLPSMRDMRREFGINFHTMEKVHGVLAEEGLIVREPRRGAFVAERPAKPRTGIIGFCGIDLDESMSSPFWSPILAGARAAMEGKDLQILLLDENSRSGWEKIDGLLINVAWGLGLLRHIPELLPRVFLLMPPSAIDGAAIEGSSVVYDNYTGMREATEHLISLGHRRIAYMHSYSLAYFFPRRLAGYHDALHAAGIEPDPRWVRRMSIPTPKYDFLNFGEQHMREWLRDDWNELGCTALLAQNDSTAIGAIKALREAGLRVPDDVSMVGFDGTEAFEYSHPLLTTIKTPLYQIGETAMQMLLRQIENDENEYEDVSLPVSLNIRESTAPSLVRGQVTSGQ